MKDITPILKTVADLRAPQQKVYLVGGGVRDRLTGRDFHDLDFALDGNTYELARRVANKLDGVLFVLDSERSTTRVLLPEKDGGHFILDFASFQFMDLLGDLRARDFTINAMALEVSAPEDLIDPCGGLQDLREKRIRAYGPTSLVDDPIRALRAVRLAVALQFSIEGDTRRQVREAGSFLGRVSPERIRDEVIRMCENSRTSLAIRLLDRFDILRRVLPELGLLKGVEQPPPHIRDVWEHTLEVCDRLEQILGVLCGDYHEESATGMTLASAVLWLGRYRNRFTAHINQYLANDRKPVGLLKLAALYHDTGKPSTGQLDEHGRLRFLGHQDRGVELFANRARELVLSKQEIERGSVIISEHMRVHSLADTGDLPTRKAIYRFFRDTGETGIDVILLSLADLWATYGHTLPQEQWLNELRTCRALLEARWEKPEQVVTPPRLLTGSDVIRMFHLAPGKLVGELLEAIREAQAAGEVSDRDSARAFAEEWLKNR